MSHAQGTATAAGQIMRSADAGTFFVVQASRGLFVSVYGGDGEAAAGVYFTEKMIAERAYEPVLQTLCAGPRPPRLQCKIAGASSLFAPVTACLAKHGVQVTKAVSRNSELELHFYAATGRILLAKEEKTASLKRKVKVLIVDDSKAMRDLLSHIFSADPEIEVVGAAALPSEVEGLIHARRPDVITLDIHMPEMDGVTLLKQFLPKYPIPTIVISSLTMQEGSLVLSALEHGAIDYVQKPSFAQLKESSGFIIDKIKTAAVAKVIRHQRQPAVRKTAAAPGSLDLEAVIAIGSSTGGPEALRQVLTGLPEKIPAILIAQHIPGVFSLALAERLNGLCAFPVREAVDGEAVVAGQALIAPGGKQMRVKKSGGVLRVVIEEGGKTYLHNPSVDRLFESVAEHIGPRAIGVVLTGMGSDGARGASKMRGGGSRIIAQDEASSVVFGMPRETIKLGGADAIVPLAKIADVLLQWLVPSHRPLSKAS